MRKLLIVLIILSFITISGNEAIFVNDPFFSPDKIDHFFTAMAIAAGTSVLTSIIINDSNSNLKIGIDVSVPLALSIIKEIYDGVSKTGEVSYKDLIYDFVGLTVGILIAR